MIVLVTLLKRRKENMTLCVKQVASPGLLCNLQIGVVTFVSKLVSPVSACMFDLL